jgi:hypothetical protein
VLAIFAKGVALPVFGPRWILRNHLERQLGDCCQSLAGVFFCVSGGVFLLECLDLPRQRFKLRKEQRVSENCLPVDDQVRRFATGHSSSAGKAASRSTSTPPTSD